ncbi:cysteine-rich receptor-like protein kinase 42 isoform X1 [Coffea arabica]|uniref:Cysteine-rich receptor-like protein kinase 42 isoform X1 n=2 Tax=Coffea arabica TaxID=13443 RepID=A0A6P6VFQ5_COFAR
MQFSSLYPVHLTTWLLIFILNLFSFTFSDPRIGESGLFCGLNRPPPNTSYIPLFVKEMEKISALVTDNNWGHYAMNQTRISIYALAQCYQDLSHTDCLLCYAASRTRLPRCLPGVSARIYLDGCFLRYDDYNFFNESTDPIIDTFNCSSSAGLATAEEAASFGKRARELVDNVSIAAAMGGGYAVRDLNGVYGLAQCWKTLSKQGCKECLAKASRNVKGCLPSREGRGLNAGCYLRYSTQKFYTDRPQNVSSSSGASKTGKTVAIASSVTAFCMISAFAAYALYARFKKTKQERRNLGRISSTYNKSNLNFKYETLEKATNYFDPKTKIGQGGAGSVHRGTLPDGKVIAVKRLFFNTRQWVDEFFNEVNLISGIQHKNLVKLLGCSIEGPESLLVYEFVPNMSLDQYLFDKKEVKVLSWKERFQIIAGIAEGIAFLHGGAEIRIVHRDIKSSNVLLDENLTPKIADFGLARHFAEDKTHLSTGIAGTLGYMAPEYLVKGQLTEKADVYSFGVLVLEIVCRRKNNAFVEDSVSLLQTVWQFYKTDKLAEKVDPSLEGEFPALEASNVLKIGLLCTQASASSRPSMDEVVHMLTDSNGQVPEPNQPPFINSSVLAPSSTGSYSSTSSLLRNAFNKFEASYTSTESSSLQSSNEPARSHELRD